MKAWQRNTEPQADRPVSLEDRVQIVNALLKDPLWKRVKPRACQFYVGERSWSIVIDETGGRASFGECESPCVIWRSDREAFDSVFAGKVLPGRIRVEGDFNALREIFAALAA